MSHEDAHGRDRYLVARIHEALLTDERLHEQALELTVVGMGRIAVHGEVATPERRAAALELIRTLAGDTEIVDDLRVSSTRVDTQPEAL
jgi:osmotically-inducible protein OsmY